MSTNLAADVASSLRAIESMALRLEDRAIDRSTDREMPGGDALVNLASVGSMTDWQRRVDLAEGLHGNGSVDLSDEDPDEFWPAVQVLWFWSEDYRQRLNHNYDDPRWRPTLLSEARFLRNTDVAAWIWGNEVHFEDYAKDVERAKTKLENILHEGERSERTPVVCDRCDDKRQLIRVWNDSPEADRWKCPGCKHEFDTEETGDALAAQMRRTEPRDWVTRTQAIGLLCDMGHQQRTAIALVTLPEAQAWKHEVTKICYVSWPDVWRAHLLAVQAAKIRLEDAVKAKAHKAACEERHDDGCWIHGRGCAVICPRGSKCGWFLCPVHQPPRRASA